MNEAKKEVLEVKVDVSNDNVKVSFRGVITESAKIELVELKEKKSLTLDFNDISYINSAGVRRWILWMWNIEKEFPKLKIFIDRCPTVMSKQIMAIMRFVPKMTQVRSFYIPYFCETCEISSVKMYESKLLLGFSDQKFNEFVSQATCEKCGSKLVIDASIEQLNKFINDYKPE